MLKLTNRQREVALLITDGYTYDEIGGILGISPSTVKAHASAVKRKLGVTRKREIGRALRVVEEVENG